MWRRAWNSIRLALPRRRGLGLDLTLLVALAGVPALVLAVVLAAQERAEDIAHVRHEAYHAAQAVARSYERSVHETEGVLRGLAEIPAVRLAGGPECSAVLAKRLEHTAFANLAAIDPSGDIVCSAVPFDGTVNVAERHYFRRAMASREFSVGGVHVGKITRRASVGLALPLLEPDGRVASVLMATLPVDTLGDVIADVPLPEGARAVVADSEGVVVAAFPPGERRWVGRDAKTLEIARIVADRRDGTAEAPGFDDLPRLFGFTQFRPGGEEAGRLSIVVGVPRAAAVANANRRFGLTLAGILIAVILSQVAARWLANVRIGRRIASLADATAKLTAGDLSARTGVAHGRDELGRLAAAFDEMAASLQRATVARGLLEAELRQAQKLEAVGRLAGGVAHDFNNLLTAILSYGRFLHEDLAPGDPRRKDAEEILRAGESAAGLTRQLLAFGRRQPIQPVIVELNPLVAGTERMLHRLLGGNVSLELRAGEAVPPVLADAGQLEQVVVNLVVNARDALPGGGTVVLETGRTLRPPRGGGEPRPHAYLGVIDDGAGMDETTQAHLFEPFFTTKEQGKGTGLGLATVFGIVDGAGGVIEVESAPGRGTAMRVYLPAAEGRSTGERAGEPRRPEGEGRETVLVVDDDDAVRRSLVRILAGRGFRTLEARDAFEARALARAEPPDLVVTDVRMPGESGVELALALRAERRDLPVLLVSGHADQAGLRSDLPLLEKPFTSAALIGRVRALLDARPSAPPPVRRAAG